MATEINQLAADIGVAVLQAGTPESLTSVIDLWLDEHHAVEVLGMDIAVIPNGSLTVMVVHKRVRREPGGLRATGRPAGATQPGGKHG